MDKSRKNLLTFSLFIIGFAVMAVVSIGLELYFGFNNAAAPEGASDNILDITKAFVFAVSLIMLLPQFYVGIKGIRVSKNPDSSKGHIVWGIILFIITLVAAVSSIIELVAQDPMQRDYTIIFDPIFEAIIYFAFLVNAFKVRNEC